MFEQLIYIVVIIIGIYLPVYYWRRHQKHISLSARKLDISIKSGLSEPVTLHPKIDPNRCISIGACVKACPEEGVLGIVNGRARIISPTKCIGHGACQAACPTDAISLVFGTEIRGVGIPNLNKTFETNVSGIYIAGELGGMGLIRNAVTQGREAVENIASNLPKNKNNHYDVVIVGAGPAGLSATLQAKKEGLRYVTLEQEPDFGGTIITYPRQKLVMTQPMIIPLHGKYKRREILKEELIDLWRLIVKDTKIEINTNEKVENVEQNGKFFKVNTPKGSYLTEKVLLTIGRRGTPRKLGVPGEKSSKVTYQLLEPEQYMNKKLLVVGGGDSAIETALALGEQKGTEVSLSYRKDAFSRIKDKNRQRIEEAEKAGKVNIYFESQVKEITNDSVILVQNDKEINLENDFVFVFIGGVMPTPFLQKIGIQLEMKFGEK